MRERLNSIDFVRGLVMVIMALDHVRDYFSHPGLNPTNLETTTAALFFTRWITHFCAPVFVFLAGTGTYLQVLRGNSKSDISKFLLSRGLWLIVLELTLVRSGWTFTPFDVSMIFVQVIWALGWSMIVLAALIHAQTRIVGFFGVLMILSHNATDGIAVDWNNPLGFLWAILHTGDSLTPFPGFRFMPFYPLIPWIGVMAAGYAFGSLYALEQAERRRIMLRIGLAVCALFILVRGSNVYGDPQPWSVQSQPVMTLLSFLNCEKYPPSLSYLCMTLGPAIILLSFAERWSNAFTERITVFGRVPMFYYLLHIPLIHGMSILVEAMRGYDPSALIGNVFSREFPPDFGFDLPIVYAFWVGIVVLLYPACVWYAKLKKKSSNPLLRYL